jgi:hypothetical protein
MTPPGAQKTLSESLFGRLRNINRAYSTATENQKNHETTKKQDQQDNKFKKGTKKLNKLQNTFSCCILSLCL